VSDLELRASDDEREAAVDDLRRHAGDGRLTLEELSTRIEAAYRATIRADLAELTRDLPAIRAESAPQPQRRGRRWVVSVMGGSTRRGRWRVAPHVNAIAVMGGCHLDLRAAEIEAPEIVIDAIAVMGGIDVIVPEGIDLEVRGFAFMGGKDYRGPAGPPPPGAPRVEVRAFAVMGGVNVRTRPRARG
jgi:hypothetical protein